MTDQNASTLGRVVSADIAVPHHEAEVRFYAKVLTTGAAPLWRQDLMNNAGTPIIGLGAQSPDYAHLPLQWMPHIQVSDITASVNRALGLGASVLMHGKNDEGESQWAVLLDPNGAAFGLIPPVSDPETLQKPSPGAPQGDTPVGRIEWLEMHVPDAFATASFYGVVTGWSLDKDGKSPNESYTLLWGDNTPVGRICQTQGSEPPVPPLWILFLPVGDLTESLRQVQGSGGKLLSTMEAARGLQKRIVIQDPVGACIGLMQRTPRST